MKAQGALRMFDTALQPKRSPVKVSQRAATVKLLVVEDDPYLSHVLTEVFAEDRHRSYRITRVPSLAEALEAIAAQSYDVVLLDLGLPDAEGDEAPRCIHGVAPELPVIVLTGTEDDALLSKIANAGVQDYLLKQDLSGKLLKTTIRYALERNRQVCKLRSQAFKDNLTGLYNRRGFFTVAEQNVHVAARLSKPLLFFYFEVEEEKTGCDGHGHGPGDLVLLRVSRALRSTFRQADVLGRLECGRFAVLTIDASIDCAAAAVARLEANLKRSNELEPDLGAIELTVGHARSAANERRTLDHLLREAETMIERDRTVPLGRLPVDQPVEVPVPPE